jgi:hypothetical protein
VNVDNYTAFSHASRVKHAPAALHQNVVASNFLIENLESDERGTL